MGATDRASWLGQIQRDRARRLEMDEAETDLRRRRPRVDLQDDDNLEENREPPPEVKPLIDIFPGVSAALLTRVFERKLKATELIRFKEKSVTELDQEDRVFKITESGGTVGFKKTATSLKDWGPNPQIWTSYFLTYSAVIGYLFSEKHPKAVPNLLMFMRQILDFAQTYQWSEAVLPLALNFHQYILDKGELSTENNLVTAPFREKYLQADRSCNTAPLSLIPQGQSPRPNTATQYPVFNPELPKLQLSPSPLYTKGWGNLLRHYPGDLGYTITGILTHGAQIGYRGSKQSCHSTNHQIHEPSTISAKLAEDLNLGRVRLASSPSFVSPLGLVPKHDGGYRRIHDLSWPPGQGINQDIPESWSAIKYMTIDDIYKQVTQAGLGCIIIKRDIKDAFRIVPVAEDNQHLLAFQWNNSTYVECCLPFGLATAPFLFNLFAEALHWILQCLLPTFYINHYLDDFIVITQSSSVSDPTGSFDMVYNRVTDYLCIPRNTNKDRQGTDVIVLGIQIDSISMEARLPPDKLCRATLDAAAALNAATAFPHGRSTRRRISYEVRDDLEWWRDSLSLFNGVLLIDPCRRPITHLYTDASNTGQGLFFFSSKSISDCWLAHCHQLHPSNAASLALAQAAHAHQVAHAHINTTEVDAILQGFLLFSHHWLHHTLVIHTDSSTAHTGLSKGFLHGTPNLNAGHLKLLWSGLSANTRSVYLSVQRSYEKHCALQNLPPWPVSTQSLTSWLTSRLLGNSNQKAVKPDTALTDLAALRAYHIDNLLDDKLFDNKHFRRLIDGARRLNPITKVRVRKPISRDTITKLSASLCTFPSHPVEMTANLLDDLNFATACRVAFAGFLRLGEFTYKTEDLALSS
ncbi:hypothetical protein N7481_001366 [Penicillium waksmanii]|uniref:uncharacterized protein n=1 Tax=Penicillium waksmanii TaxID=69791 RepID=UPI002546B6EE|nr:uncharacterized protein N7481_001366 [Penicillium waksmanii]KAJ6000957.1 hypothetical protein N7481_001366 [Penicillium waksmanii]